MPKKIRTKTYLITTRSGVSLELTTSLTPPDINFSTALLADRGDEPPAVAEKRIDGFGRYSSKCVNRERDSKSFRKGDLDFIYERLAK